MKLHLGTILEVAINIITFGWGKYISAWIAVDLFGFESCGCCERKEWLNRLTDKEYNGYCNTNNKKDDTYSIY
tara:strand:- start:223 stop:441 length:219 start_codon:yes stop_codon:yes gene_type:complete